MSDELCPIRESIDCEVKHMLVLGLSLPVTRHGKNLKDGSVAIIQDGEILIASAEERTSRLKHAGGFESALPASLAYLGLDLCDFDSIVVSSCCEDVYPRRIEELLLSNDTAAHFIPSHHLSHAYSTFFASTFDRALILVMDGGGNVIGRQKHLQWWKDPREQVSYFIGEGEEISLIGRDFDGANEVGFGEAYRAFTYYLGWPSYSYSANTMALAAYGNPDKYPKNQLFRFNNGRLRSIMINNPPDPRGMIMNLANELGLQIPVARNREEVLTQEHMDLASFIQRELEDAMIARVRSLVSQTGIRDLCIAGGVGLNCVANMRLLQETPIERIFIQPAAGDDGQALGNALFGYHHLLGQKRKQLDFNVYLGKMYDLASERSLVDDATLAQTDLQITRELDLPFEVATLLSEGKVVGWFQGRSEYGPRALGNRSILADPRKISMRERCREIKKREFFRPFAPSILEEYASSYFELNHPSPHMLIAARVKARASKEIPAVVHVDSTARVQTVSRPQNPLFYEVVAQFGLITGIPVLLNTSFNRRGEPLVESPRDAMDAFVELGLDALAIGDFLIQKRNGQHNTLPLEFAVAPSLDQ